MARFLGERQTVLAVPGPRGWPLLSLLIMLRHQEGTLVAWAIQVQLILLLMRSHMFLAQTPILTRS